MMFELKAFVAGLSDAVADHAVGANTSHIRHKHLCFAGHVSTHIPGVSLRIKREIGLEISGNGLFVFGFCFRLNRHPLPFSHPGYTIGNPINVLFNRNQHIAEYRRTGGASAGQQVRESLHA